MRTMALRFFSLLALATLLLAGTPLTAAQTSSSELKFDDPKGDVLPFINGVGTPPLASTPVTDAGDLTSFRLYSEDLESFVIEIGVANLKPLTPPGLLFGGEYLNVNTRFKLDGTAVTYDMYVTITQQMTLTPSGQVAAPSRFCTFTERMCVQQRVFTVVDWEKSLIITTVPKAALAGMEPAPGEDRRPAVVPEIKTGSRLAEFVVVSRAGAAFFGGVFNDRMPNQGSQGPYQMESGSANNRIRLRLHVAEDEMSFDPFVSYYGQVHDYPQASVSPQQTSLVQVVVENINAGKRLINLSAQMVDSKDAQKWDVRIVPTITVPGEDARIVNLIVNVSAGVEHRSQALVRVTAKSLGFADEIGVMKIRLTASVPPSPSAKDVYFHAFGSGPNQVCLGLCISRQWMNTLETDPESTSTAVGMSQRSGALQSVEYYSLFRLDAPLGFDTVLKTTEPITATLNFRAQVPISGVAKLELSAGDTFLGTGEVPWGGSGAAQISFQPSVEAERIPAGAVLQARVLLVASGANAQPFLGLLRPEFVLTGSKFTLPIVADPTPTTRNAIPAGPAFLTLEVKDEAEEFVNPGKTRLFKITIVNEGVQEDTVKINVTQDPEDWSVELRPSEQYRLKPGESATFGVLVKAPAEAKEGDQCHVLLNATSTADPSALAQAALTAIVTEGVEIEDEADNFTADEDTIMFAEETQSKKSPGAGSLAVLAVVGLVALLWRRRRPA